MEATLTALKVAMWCMQRFGTMRSHCEWRVRAKAAESLQRSLHQGKAELQKSVLNSSKITRIMWKPPFNKAHLKVLTIACCATGYSPWGLHCVMIQLWTHFSIILLQEEYSEEVFLHELWLVWEVPSHNHQKNLGSCSNLGESIGKQTVQLKDCVQELVLCMGKVAPCSSNFAYNFKERKTERPGFLSKLSLLLWDPELQDPWFQKSWRSETTGFTLPGAHWWLQGGLPAHPFPWESPLPKQSQRRKAELSLLISYLFYGITFLQVLTVVSLPKEFHGVLQSMWTLTLKFHAVVSAPVCSTQGAFLTTAWKVDKPDCYFCSSSGEGKAGKGLGLYWVGSQNRDKTALVVTYQPGQRAISSGVPC